MKARRIWAWPLVPVYWAGLRVKDGLRAAGLSPTRHLHWPVVSIGSLSAGGAGKTPAAIALAEMLHARAWHVDVLSRGYGRQGTAVGRVDLDDPEAAHRFGDEPVLIAQTAGVPVWVGAQRFAAGTLAEGDGPETKGVHLLDDGFQHRQLARAFDAVLVTEEDLADALLPAGNRREPVSALKRADAVVLREDEREVVESPVRRWMRPGVPLWCLRRRMTLPPEVSDAAHPFIAFCGIARPREFFAMLRSAGMLLAREVTFPDHHTYTLGDMSRLVESCHLGNGGGFVITEKDAVKIGPELRARLEAAGPVHVARLAAEFIDPERVVRALEERLR